MNPRWWPQRSVFAISRVCLAGLRLRLFASERSSPDAQLFLPQQPTLSRPVLPTIRVRVGAGRHRSRQSHLAPPHTSYGARRLHVADPVRDEVRRGLTSEGFYCTTREDQIGGVRRTSDPASIST